VIHSIVLFEPCLSYLRIESLISTFTCLLKDTCTGQCHCVNTAQDYLRISNYLVSKL